MEKTQLYTLDEDMFEHKMSSRLSYNLYSDQLLSSDNEKYIKPIEWHWESAIQTFKSTEYRKKLLHTNFCIDGL